MELEVPIVAAPMGGGASTPALVRGVAAAGGLGFLAAGYKDPEQVVAQLDAVEGVPYGLNLFAAGPPGDPDAVAAYARRLVEAGLEPLGTPRHDDDHLTAKLELLLTRTAPPPAVVSFAFGCPEPEAITALQQRGSEVWLTVTAPAEAERATAAGADALVVQGAEAGAHRGSWTNDPAQDDALGLLVLLQLVPIVSPLPLVAAGGIATGRGIAAVLAAGAEAAQLGTAFLKTPEAGTSDVHRAAVGTGRPTALTRAYTGRPARGITTPFMADHDDAAPAAYPEVHHLTAPLRARRDPDTVHLWAGQAHALTREEPAAELVGRLWAEARLGR